MLKHHPHSTWLSVAAVSHQPVESDTSQQQTATIWDLHRQKRATRISLGPRLPSSVALKSFFLEFDKEPRERV